MLFWLPFFSAAACSRLITREELLVAIKSSPEIYRYKDDRMVTAIDGSEKRKVRPRPDQDNALPDFAVCQVTKIVSGYTRFKTPELMPNVAAFEKLYKASGYRKVKDQLGDLTLRNDFNAVYRVSFTILEMCQLVLPENNPSSKAKMLLGKKRSMLKWISGENPAFIALIRSSEELITEALKMVETHLFGFLAPLGIDFATVELSEIVDVSFFTTKYIYTILLNIVSIAIPASPAHKAIEAYPDLIQKLYQLLYLPDARERKQVEIILINLFNCHPNMQKSMLSMLKFKYMEMKEYFRDSVAFIFHDILAVHRGYYLIVKDDPGNRSEAMAHQLEGMFLVHVIPLIELPDLPDFADQWTFIMLEIGPHIDDSLDLFMKHAFVTKSGVPGTNYYRDQELIIILDNLLTQVEAPCEIWISVIQFLFDKACSMVVRPSMQDTFLGTFFSEKSAIWKAFNVEDGTFSGDLENYPVALFHIMRGLFSLFITFHELEFDLPGTLYNLIWLWMPAKVTFEWIAPAGGEFLLEEGKELAALELRYKHALGSYVW